MATARAPHICVTGGAGYIGTHTCVELLQSEFGFKVTVLDNMVNCSPEAIPRVEKITSKKVQFIKIDLATEPDRLTKVFAEQKFDAVIHFAGLKAVGESVQQPLRYYRNNLNSTINLADSMEKTGCKLLIASSSATVYGEPEKMPITEEFLSGLYLTNPYGKTKHFLEHILQDWAKVNGGARVVLLRYFNPVGAHKSGLIGEDPRDIPNNLMPYISQVAVGRRPHLNVFGNDYPTPDGTGVRDYLHVVDLARGHVAALEKVLLEKNPPKPDLPGTYESKQDASDSDRDGTWIYNLGRGTGTSVLEMVDAMSKACGHEIKTVITKRREGDIATCYCDPSKAEKELKWKCEFDLEKICEDTWRWQSLNPMGFDDPKAKDEGKE